MRLSVAYGLVASTVQAGMRAAGVTVLLVALLHAPTHAAALDDQAAAWAARDARTLLRAAPRLVDGAIAPTFTAMDRRVFTYADWVYGWLSSLLTAWELAAAGVYEAQQEISAGRMPDTASLHASLADVVERRFDETVVLPDRTDAALAAAWQRSMRRLSDLDDRLAAERRTRILTAASLLDADPRPALERFGAPLLASRLTISEPPSGLTFRALSAVEADAGGTTDQILIRSLRPLVTRAVSVTTRVLLAPVAGGIIASPVVGTNGLAAAAATLAAVSAGIWGLDYAINSVDSALTRPGFEADLRLLVRDAHLRASRMARRHAESTVCAALAGSVPCDAMPVDATPVDATPVAVTPAED